MSYPIEIESEAQWGMYSQKPGISVIDLYATWCKSCIENMPEYEKLCTIYKDVSFCKLDIDNDELEDIISLPEINVKTIPMFLFIVDGEIEDRYMGTDMTCVRRIIDKITNTFSN